MRQDMLRGTRSFDLSCLNTSGFKFAVSMRVSPYAIHLTHPYVLIGLNAQHWWNSVFGASYHQSLCDESICTLGNLAPETSGLCKIYGFMWIFLRLIHLLNAVRLQNMQRSTFNGTA
jgi:hypothetical protein